MSEWRHSVYCIDTLAKKGGWYNVIRDALEILIPGIVSGVTSTYIVRVIDILLHKNNRHEWSERSFLC